MERLTSEQFEQYKADADMKYEDDYACVNEAGYCLQQAIEFKCQNGQAGGCRIEKIALIACELALRSLESKKALEYAITEIVQGIWTPFRGDFERYHKEYTDKFIQQAKENL